MLLYVFFRFLHFVAIFGVAAAVIIENIAVKPSISKEDAINLAKISLIDNVSLLLTLMAGYTLWFWVGKPSEFYTENPVFLAKLIIFCIILVFGFFPFNFFKRNKKSIQESVLVPPTTIFCVRLRGALLIVAVMLAFLAARGIGLSY